MDLTQPIDSYCERLDTGLWAEPLNAISNIAFIIAGIAALKLFLDYRKQGGKRAPDVLSLPILLLLIGIGSTLFHTFATGWAMLGDVIPIVIFMHMFLWVTLRRVFRLRLWQSALGLLGFIISNYALPKILLHIADFNGSEGYFTTLAALIIMSLMLFWQHHIYARYFLISSALFILSLALRTLDMDLCPVIIIGTHFWWHLLNGLILYLLVRTVILSLPAKR